MQGLFSLAKRAKSALQKTLGPTQEIKQDQRSELLRPKADKKHRAIQQLTSSHLDSGLSKLQAHLEYYKVIVDEYKESVNQEYVSESELAAVIKALSMSPHLEVSYLSISNLKESLVKCQSESSNEEIVLMAINFLQKLAQSDDANMRALAISAISIVIQKSDSLMHACQTILIPAATRDSNPLVQRVALFTFIQNKEKILQNQEVLSRVIQATQSCLKQKQSSMLFQSALICKACFEGDSLSWMHSFFYKILHFLPQFTHLSLICHFILEYAQVYLTDHIQEDRVSLLSFLLEIVGTNINPRVILPVSGLLMELGIEKNSQVDTLNNALLDVAFLSSSQPHREMAFEYLNELAKSNPHARDTFTSQISGFKITTLDSASIKKHKLKVLIILSSKLEQNDPNLGFILSQIHYWLNRGDRKSKELFTSCLSEQFQSLENKHFKVKVQEYLMESFQKREDLNIEVQKKLFETVLAKTSQDQLGLLYSLFKISKEKSQNKEAMRSIICSLISKNVQKVPILALETLRQFALTYKPDDEEFSLSVMELCLQILTFWTSYPAELRKKAKVIIGTILRKTLEGTNVMLKTLSKNILESVSDIQEGKLKFPIVVDQISWQNVSKFQIPWLSSNTSSVKLKDQIIPKHYTVIQEQEKPSLEKFSIDSGAVKEERTQKIKGNFEAAQMEAEIRVTQKGREFTNLTQEDLDDFFSN